MPRPGRPAAERNWRRQGPLLPTLAILAVLILAIVLGAQFWTELLWFDSVGFETVFATEISTKIILFVLGAAITGLAVASSLIIGYRDRPIYAPVTVEQQNLDRYREMLDPLRRLASIAVPALLGLFAGSAAAGQWQTFLLWRNRVPFGTRDAQFHLDVGFFVFTLPWLDFLVGFATMTLVLAAIAAAVTHYVYGGLQLQGRTGSTTSAARIHLSILLAALVLVRAVSYWLSRYSLATQDSKLITGVTYTGDHAVLPTKAVLAVACLITAGLFVATIWSKSWRLPIIGTAGLLVVAVLLGGIYPALVQSLKVNPSEKQLEQKYIQRNIEATRSAYSIAAVKPQTYDAETTATQGQLQADAETIPGIRLVDPAVVSPTFQQTQAIKSYYQFPDTLDVDRYVVGSKLSDTVIAARELQLDGVPPAQRNWLNDHTYYTHGYGVVAAYGNRRDNDGLPVFYESKIPAQGSLGTFEPRIYFGEESPDYSIVGGPAKSQPLELDYPDSTSGGQKNTMYTGKGGVAIGGFARRLAYAIKYRELKFMLSDRVNSDSRLLDTRKPLDRVGNVAPWLTLDGNPYPAVVDGRIKWIVDGYTTTAQYPYSKVQSISDSTSDSLTERSTSVEALQSGHVNYIRNSVKATVDAYDGSVHLYAWDDQDPLLRAWAKAFRNTVEPMSHISGALMSHLRYPEDLFKVQRAVLARYHVADAGGFYGGQDYWRVSPDPENNLLLQPPYYLSIAMPGQTSPDFSLTTSFIPNGSRQQLSGYLAADSNAGSTAGVRSPGYGVLRLLELPTKTAVLGPAQVQNNINSRNVPSPQFSLTLAQFLEQNKTSTVRGNLLTLPVGNGLLYVEPIYLRNPSGSSSYPLATIVVAAFGQKLAWSDTLGGALDGLFGGNSGVNAGGTGSSGSGSTGSGSTGSGSTGSGSATTGALGDALRQAQKALTDSQAALAKGDFAAYGKAQQQLKDAIAKAVAAQPKK